MTAQFAAVRDVPLADLTYFPGNARRGNIAVLQESIRRNGQYRALVVRDTGTELIILAGNHTFDAIAAEGYATARCEILRCDDTTAKRINLADNRTAELASYDDEALAGLLEELNADFDGTGWTAEDLDGFRQLLAAPDLDKLGKELGPPGDDDTWPTVRIRAPHNVVAAWNDYVKTRGGDDAEAFAALLDVELLG
jgi:hypothetical protein